MKRMINRGYIILFALSFVVFSGCSLQYGAFFFNLSAESKAVTLTKTSSTGVSVEVTEEGNYSVYSSKDGLIEGAIPLKKDYHIASKLYIPNGTITEEYPFIIVVKDAMQWVFKFNMKQAQFDIDTDGFTLYDNHNGTGYFSRKTERDLYSLICENDGKEIKMWEDVDLSYVYGSKFYVKKISGSYGPVNKKGTLSWTASSIYPSSTY